MTPDTATKQRQSLPGRQPGWSPLLLGRNTLLALVLLVAAVIIGCLSLLPSSDSTAARIARTGVIRIGYAVEAPFAFLNDQGQVTGESPEVARVIWQRLGIGRIEWVQSDFASLIPQLRAGRFDQIASGLFIRPDRERLVIFTQPSLCLQPALLVRRGNPMHLHDLNDIASQQEVRLAVIAGAVEGEDAVQAGIPGDRILAFPNTGLALQGIRHGLADALALSAPTVKQLASANPDMQRALPLTPLKAVTGCGAFAFRNEDKQLRQQFNLALAGFLGSREHLQLLHSFGLGEEELPANLQQKTQDSR